MADIDLVFDSGAKSFELSDGRGHSVEVSFNPYDALFLGSIMAAVEKLDEKQTALKSLDTDDWTAVYEASMAADKEMREILDGIFDAPICAALFPKQTVFAVGGGLPVWLNLLYAVIDQMDAGVAEEKKQAQARVKKYSNKYKKK